MMTYNIKIIILLFYYFLFSFQHKIVTAQQLDQMNKITNLTIRCI
jgi:hypothetical protein